MYNVFSIGIIAAILYSFSYVLYRFGFYAGSLHRKIWNVLLALAFITTALAGIFLALQVNYKWNLPYIKTILKWHVECGLAFAFTGILHLSRHLKYYLTRSESDISSSQKPNLPGRSTGQNKFNLFILGFISTSFQLLFLREMMNISGGYELVAGTFLASWLIISAAGSSMARRSTIAGLKEINIFFAASPLFSLTLMVILYRLFLTPGETPSFLISLLYTLITLLPVTFISGFLFIKLIEQQRITGNAGTGKSFATETAGGIAAGIIISLTGSSLLNTYQMLFLIIISNAIYLLVSFTPFGNRHKLPVVAAGAAIALVILFLNPDRLFRQMFLPVIKVTSTTDTPYGNLTRGTYNGEVSTWYNNYIVSWQNNETEREENIHYAMLQHPSPREVLVISGDIISSIPEIEKYSTDRITYVERDPALAGLSRGAAGSGRFELVEKDAFSYIKKTGERFDVITLLLPPPSTLMLNRYYTAEFFKAAKKRLGSAGIFMCSPGPGETYFNQESIVLYSSVYNSLKSVFRNVIPLVGNKLYYIASDTLLSLNICTLLSENGISNSYVSPDFLSDDLIRMKSEAFMKMLKNDVRINSLSQPFACFHYQKFSLSKSGEERIPAIVILLLVFLIPVIAVGPGKMTMYASAGALAGFEIIILLVLQSTAGNMYQLTGLVIAAAMSGLAAGAYFGTGWKYPPGKWFAAASLCAFYAFAAVVYDKLSAINYIPLIILILLVITFLPAYFTGQLFTVLSGSGLKKFSASDVYSADLAGSALGFIAVSSLSIPLLGIRTTLFLLAAAILTAMLFGTISDK
jgi:spermidine synthase